MDLKKLLFQCSESCHQQNYDHLITYSEFFITFSFQSNIIRQFIGIMNCVINICNMV